MSNPTEEPLVELFRHHLWANLRLLDSCEALSKAQLDATAHGTFGSIHATLIHLAGSDESYLARLTGERPADAITKEAVVGIADLRAHLRRSGEGLIQVAGRASTLGRIRVAWGEQAWQFPASIILIQAINHATEHRAHVMTIITQLGIEPSDVSGWEYGVAIIPPED
jgi:uncharacterized damage-inducible protein DinB